MSESAVLLLSDVVDSTQLTEQLDLASLTALWTAHDRAARALLQAWRGREIDKSDGFLLTFESVADAAGFAQAYHQALQALPQPLATRVGIHVGPVTLRRNPEHEVALGAKPVEVEGAAKPLAARVMALARGGQTLLSPSARAALGEASSWRLHSHGHWRLKGLEAPIELFELGDAEAAFVPPPDAAKAWRVVRQGELWLPVREVRHTLPAERDSFVGREPALQELAQHFERGARLVSLLGIGGTGKTRLAQRFGWTWLGDFPGGVWFCDLSQATTADGIVHAVAQGLELPLGQADPVQQIGQAIAGRGACLVILDNYEQVARHAEATLGRWLDKAREARFLVTTREVLGIVGEQAMALAPLPTDDGVALFMRRAAAATAAFAPAGEDAAAIGPLVKLLDGLPLAIELCAARVRVMPPRMLLQRMGERFKLLTSSGGRHDRQATLKATLDWSWDLLSEVERSALAQLSVFEGGFTLEAAEAVVDINSFDGDQGVLDVVQALVQKSLVRKASDIRFDLLRSVQDYAFERSKSSVDLNIEASTATARHWRHYSSLSEAAATANRSEEADNLVAACKRAAKAQDRASVGALVAAWYALRSCGPFSVALDLSAIVFPIARNESHMLAKVGWVAGSAHLMLGQLTAALEQLEAATELRFDDQELSCTLSCALGDVLSMTGDVERARSALKSAVDLAMVGDARDVLRCKALNGLGALLEETGDHVGAREHFEEALRLAEQMEDVSWCAALHANLGVLEYSSGRIESSFQHSSLAVSLSIRCGDRRWEGNARCNLGMMLLERGAIAEAEVELLVALEISRSMGHVRLEATVLCNLGLAAERRKGLRRAVELHRAAVALISDIGDRRAEGQFRAYLGRVLAQCGLSNEAMECFVEALRLIGSDDLGSMGLVLSIQAQAEATAGRAAFAEVALIRSEEIASKLSIDAASEFGRELDAARQMVMASLATPNEPQPVIPD